MALLLYNTEFRTFWKAFKFIDLKFCLKYLSYDSDGFAKFIIASNINLPSFTKIIFSTFFPSVINIVSFPTVVWIKAEHIWSIKSVLLHPLKIKNLFIASRYITKSMSFLNLSGKLLTKFVISFLLLFFSDFLRK